MNIAGSLNLKTIGATIYRFRTILVLGASLIVCGYTAYQISQVVAITPTAAMISAAETSATPVETFDHKTIDSISQHESLNVSPDLTSIGTSNPFFAQ
ncbi:MAG: hypothetical protein ACHQUB_00440 [Candidatus Saccharimonadia bacterium]